jgi:pimeloyl-ACP methyl ester carboxylesterase
VIGGKAGGGGHLDQCRIKAPLEVAGNGEVLHQATAGADQVVMVVTGEILGQFKAAEFVVGDDPVHHSGALEHRQVPVCRRLGQGLGTFQHLRHGKGTLRGSQEFDQGAALGGVALFVVAQTQRGMGVQFAGGRSVATCVRVVARACHAVMLARPPRRLPGPTGSAVRLADVDLSAPPDIGHPGPAYSGARRPDRSRWVDSAGLAIAAYEWGEPDAPVIFMAHGGFDFAGTFDLLAPMLADAGWRCVSWDARGHGHSQYATLYSWTADGRDAMAVLDTVTDEPVVFLGHSKGGGMMLDMAHAVPHRLSHLVNLDGLPSRNAWPDLAEHERTTMLHSELSAWLDHRRRAASLSRKPGTRADLAARRQRMNPRLDLDWLEYVVPVGATEEADGWRWNIDPSLRFGGFGPWRPEWAMEHLPGVGVPVLGVLGLEMEVMGWGTRPDDVLGNLPPLGRYEGLDGVGHFMHIEAADQVAALVLDFLGDPPVAGGGRTAPRPVAPGFEPPVPVTPAVGVRMLEHGRSRLALHELAASTTDGAHPLLVLHGLGEATTGLLPACAAWPGAVLGLDFTGHGLSSLPLGGGYTAEILMADVDAVLAEVGEVTIFGRGLGAYIALLAAGGRPELVHGAVLADGPGLVGGGIRPHSPSLTPVGRGRSTPDPMARLELARDVRPPDYAVDFVRQALEWSALADPIAVCTRVRPEWLQAVVSQPGVVDTTVEDALGRYADATRP